MNGMPSFKWQRGVARFRRGRHASALTWLEQAEAGLPEGGDHLRQQLALTYLKIAAGLMWPDGQQTPTFDLDADRILEKVGIWYPERKRAFILSRYK